MAVSYMVYYTVSTLVAVPYSSLSTEITTDVKTRSKVNLTRLLFSLSSTALCTLIPSLLFNLVRDNKFSVDAFYWTIVLGFGFFFTIPVLIAGIFSRERAPYPSAKSRFSLSAIFLPFRVKAFRKLLILYLAQAITMDIVTATVYYYAHYVVMINSTIFLACFLAVQVLAFPLVNYLVGKVSKVKIYRFLLPLTLLGAAGIGFYPASWPAWGLYVLSGITAVGFAGAQIMPWIIFPDVVDIGVLSSKERNAGVFSSGMTLIRKISSALALAIVGGILSLAGYLEPPNENPAVFLPQPDSAIWGIRMTIFLSFAVFMSIAYIISFTFKLTPEVSEKVKLLNEKHAQKIPLSDEEKTEEEKILKEYAK
jgi:Na+/melibiose symporter-like transporter